MAKITKTVILSAILAVLLLSYVLLRKQIGDDKLSYKANKIDKTRDYYFGDIFPKTTEEKFNRITSFKLNHEKIVRTLQPKQFCYVVPTENGYGNKLISVVNAFVVALLTSSAVIINMTEIERHIQEPLYKCFQESSAINNELSYLFSPERVYMMPMATKISYNPKKNLSQLYLDIPGGYDRYAFKGKGLSLYLELACNREYFNTFLFYGLVRPDTIENALTVLDSPDVYKNSDEMVNKMYRVGFELAHSILNIFWQPVPTIQQEVDEFVTKYFEGNFVIGMQFRFEFMDWNDTELFFQCARTIYGSFQHGKVKKAMKW
jgi:hypothetical protein